MIVGITIKNFKGIREIVNLPLSRFHVLVDPNGVGKTTFLDAIDFVRDCLAQSPGNHSSIIVDGSYISNVIGNPFSVCGSAMRSGTAILFQSGCQRCQSDSGSHPSITGVLGWFS